jgi:hypothetical protein
MTYENFSQQFLSNKKWGSTTLGDLYLKRSEAYFKGGDLHSAAVDFRRAATAYAEYGVSIDRWREIGSVANSHVYMDMKTFDDARNDSVKIWVK